MAKAKVVDVVDLTIEDKLRALYEFQRVDSEIDKIKILRGELPLEVQDLEDEVEGLETRISNFLEEAKQVEANVAAKKNEIVESKALIKKYLEQQNNVRNNREYDSLTKEIEFQKLEMELCEKRIKEFNSKKEEKTSQIDTLKASLKDKKEDLKSKKNELDEIIEETKKEEEQLIKKLSEVEKLIDERLLTAYKKIRKNARNGLAVVSVQRDACGGCFNQIPPQRQLDICSRRKIIVCEYCGRILVDVDINKKAK